jgi:5'(3')-deoxyribonucleotidase
MIKIALDADGTLFKTNDLVCRLINYKYGTFISSKDIKSWSFWDDMGMKKEFWETFNLIALSNIRLSSEPYDENTINVLNAFLTHPFLGMVHIDIVTCNTPESVKFIQEWLSLRGIRALPIIHLGHVCPSEKLNLDYDVYIDDNPNLAEKIVDFPGKRLLLANARWNENIQNSSQITRFRAWKELPDALLPLTRTPFK